MNLLSNAIKYTNPGGTVSHTLTELSSIRRGYGKYQINVQDNGIGMSQEFLEHIFDIFERERNEETKLVQGTGLGMSIVKRLVEAMDGKIDIDSAPNKGTTVTVTIYLRFAEAEPIKEQDNKLDVNLAGLHVLLTEDNELNREIATEILKDKGLTVDCAEDGSVAIQKVFKNPEGTYDFILMDIQMPNIDGYKATEMIRAMDNKVKSSIPIIAMTANAFAEDKKRAMEAGMNGHTAKPMT